MTQKEMLYLAGALVLGYLVGSGKLKSSVGTANPTKHNDTEQPQEWWSYAGSWQVA